MRIFNCLNEDVPIHVELDGALVPLERRTPPTITSMEQGEPKRFEHPAGSFELGVGPGKAEVAFFLPDPEPDTLFLVEPETMLLCPDRDDFVTPALYRLVSPATRDEPLISVLTAIHTSLEQLTSETERVAMKDFQPHE